MTYNSLRESSQYSLTESGTEEETDLKYQNYGYVKGQIISVSEQPDINGKYLYMVRPAIDGTYKKPVRVVTAVLLKVGKNYHFRGYLNTIIKDRKLIPFLNVVRIKKTNLNKLTIVDKGQTKERLKETSFFALQDVTVKSITPIGDNSLYIVFTKKIDLGTRCNYLKLNCISPKATRYLSSLTEGDVVSNILLSMHINDEVGLHHFNEKSLRIIEYNLPQDKLVKLVKHIDKRF